MKKIWPILSSILATALRNSVGVLGPNEAKTHSPGFMRLTADGPPNSLAFKVHSKQPVEHWMFLGLQGHHNFPWVQRLRHHEEFMIDLEEIQPGILWETSRRVWSATSGNRFFPPSVRIPLQRCASRSPEQGWLSDNVIAAILKSRGARPGTPSANNSSTTKNKSEPLCLPRDACRQGPNHGSGGLFALRADPSYLLRISFG